MRALIHNPPRSSYPQNTHPARCATAKNCLAHSSYHPNQVATEIKPPAASNPAKVSCLTYNARLNEMPTWRCATG